MKFLETPISPPLGVLHIVWSVELGFFRVWTEPGGEPFRVRDLLVLALVMIAWGLLA